MKLLSQRDLRWASTKIGLAPFTVGQKGCYLTDIVNGANAIGANPKNLTPGDIAKDVACFTDKFYKRGPGLVIPTKVASLLGRLRFDGSQEVENDVEILKAIKDPRRFVVLEVNDGAHFVLGWSKNIWGRILAGDPWDGTVCDVKKKYKNIVGARYFSII